MRITALPVFLAILLFAGCGTPYQGIKFRAEGPAMAEAFRSLTLALTVDGYTLRSVDPQNFKAETDWRSLPAKEKPTALATTEQSGQLTLRMEARGKLYDVFLLPSVRTVSGRDTITVPAPADHPLRLKWQRMLTTLLRKEQREED